MTTAGQTPPDADLMARMSVGDRAAADVLLARYRDRILDLIRSVARGEGDPEDILQEVWVRVWKYANRFDPSLGSFIAWLNTVALHEAVNALRRLRRQERRDSAPAPRPPAASESSCPRASRREGASPLRLAIEKLDSPAREILQMRLLESKKFEAIGRVLGKPLNTIKTIFYRTCRSIGENNQHLLDRIDQDD